MKGKEVTEKKRSMTDYYKIPDKEYQKAVGQLTMQFSAVLHEMFDMYGLGVFIPWVVKMLVKISEDFALRCRGVDKPISVEYARRSKIKK